MTKLDLCMTIQNNLLKLRKETELSQEVFADMIGVTKKTYIQLEKERSKLKWSEAVTISTLFQDTDTIQNIYGEDIIEIIQVLALKKMPKRQLPTLGGTKWWTKIRQEDDYVLQQHKLTKHYRILDKNDYRVFFSLSEIEAFNHFSEYLGEGRENNESN